MFVPELLPKATRRRHRQTFFGDSRSKPFAVLTPIKKIFDEIAGDEPVNGNGWWPCQFLNNTLLVLIPQGAPSIDALCSLEPNVQIIFVGLAGALRGLSFGEIVEPSVAILGRRRYRRTSSSPAVYRDVTVGTVNSLNESLERRNLLREQADCVDMETAWVFASANNQGRDAKSVLIISDHLFRKTFVTTSLVDLYPAIQQVAQEIARMTTMAEDVNTSLDMEEAVGS
jgi:Type I 3-dehydroquinase